MSAVCPNQNANVLLHLSVMDFVVLMVIPVGPIVAVRLIVLVKIVVWTDVAVDVGTVESVKNARMANVLRFEPQ